MCNRSKTGACRHLSFVTYPVLSSFIGKLFFVQFHIFGANYSEGGYFFKCNKFSLNDYKK